MAPHSPNAGTTGGQVVVVVSAIQSAELTNFDNIHIGQDASTLTKVNGVTGNLGVFGQQADTVTINNLRQQNYATTAAAFTLPNLHMSFTGTGC